MEFLSRAYGFGGRTEEDEEDKEECEVYGRCEVGGTPPSRAGRKVRCT